MLENGKLWKDISGNPIHAHGGWIIKVGEYYYWYGENRSEGIYVDCYRSLDLMNWEFRNHVLTVSSKRETARVVKADLKLFRDPNVDYGEPCLLLVDGEDPYLRVNLERPKVLYNSKTGKFVMWMHFENGVNYFDARLAIASCDTPDGDFVYHGSFRPYGFMSRDCTVFQDDDGTAYFISTTRDNAELNIYRMSEDYLNVDGIVNTLFQGEYREAPALFKHNGRYYMINSGCSGWDPNQCCYSSADSIDGRWSLLQNCADETTYDSQPAFVLTVFGEESTTHLYFGDRWSGGEYFSSSYLVLPLTVDNGNRVILPYNDCFSIDVKKGLYEILD